MNDAWDRFRELLRRCPQHGYELWSQVQTFYNGLNYLTRSLADATCGGSITSKTAKETHQLFEELAKNNNQAPSERLNGRKLGGILEMDRVSSLEAKFGSLMNKLNQQSTREPTIWEIVYKQAQVLWC